MNKKRKMTKQKQQELFESFLSFLTDFTAEMKQSIVDEVLVSLNGQITLNKLFYSLDEVSELTSITRRALKGRIDRGTLVSVKDGNTILVPKDELQRFISRLETSSNRKMKKVA